MEKEKGEATVELNWMLAVWCNWRYCPLGQGNTDSGTVYLGEEASVIRRFIAVHCIMLVSDVQRAPHEGSTINDNF